jgi:hypothetical protein
MLKALRNRHQNKTRDDAFFTEVKTGSTWFGRDLLKIDALAVAKSWAHPRITAYEVKSCRSDFTSDNKWPGYMQYCHELYIVCPSGEVHSEELDEQVGLLWWNPDKGSLHTKRRAVHRAIEIPESLFYYIVISRLDSDRHPFFSSAREQLEAWVQDKNDRQALSVDVNKKIYDVIQELRRQRDRLQQQLDASQAGLEHWKLVLEHWKLVQELMSKCGIRYHRYDSRWLTELEAALKGGIPPRLTACVKKLRALGEIVDELDTAMNAVGEP